jgi:hypothetical protein
MIEPRADRPQAITLGTDKAYDAEDFVNELRLMNATSRVAQNTNGRSSAIDGRTTRNAGYAVRALSRSPSIGTFWAISLRLPDMQIIDFARVGRPAPVAVDK